MRGAYQWKGQTALPDEFGSIGAGSGTQLILVPDFYERGEAEMTAYFPTYRSESPQCMGGYFLFNWESVSLVFVDKDGVRQEFHEFPLIGTSSPRLKIPKSGLYAKWKTEVEQTFFFEQPTCLNLAGAELAAGPERSLPLIHGDPDFDDEDMFRLTLGLAIAFVLGVSLVSRPRWKSSLTG